MAIICPLMYEIEKELQRLGELTEGYNPKFFSWCKSYEQEEREMRETIEGNPADVKLLKQEYYELTGKRYKRKS